MKKSELYERGEAVRREMYGDAALEKALAHDGPSLVEVMTDVDLI